MTRWAAFIGLTGVVLTLLLALARLSQRAVHGPGTADGADSVGVSAPPEPDGHTGTSAGPEGPQAETPAEPTAPDREDARADGAVASNHRLEEPPAPAPRDAGGPAVDQLSGEAGPELTTGALLANVAFTQGLFGAVLAGGAWYFEVPAGALGLAPAATGPGAVALGVGFGVALWLANEGAAAVADAAGAGYDERLRAMLAPDSAPGWAVLLGMVLPVVAVVEEFIFRAAVVGAPAAGFGVSPWALAAVSSLAFALGHGAQGRAGILVTGGLGLALAAGFVLTDSLVVVVVAHYLVNALEFLVHEYAGRDRLL